MFFKQIGTKSLDSKFFLSFSFWSLLPTQCTCRGLLSHLITLDTPTYTHTHTHSRTPLNEGSSRRRDLYLTAHNTHNRQTSTPPSVIRTHNPSKRAAADLRPRPRGKRDHLTQSYLQIFFIINCSVFFIGQTVRPHFTVKWHRNPTKIASNTL